MVELFDNDDTGYLKWVQANPHGFVANVDRAGTVSQYPMIHAATHGSMSSPKIGNVTTGDYIKFCGTDLGALEEYALTMFGRPLTRYSHCV